MSKFGSQTRANEIAERTGVRAHGIVPMYRPISIPPEVIVDRDHRATLVPLNTTARLMNDPLPGCSAAEMPRAASPSFYSDPLDALVCTSLRLR